MKTATKDRYLVYDVGMHKGEDTEFYLKKGFKVIAFEANPDLIQRAKQKFVHEIATGQLVIVEGAIVANGSDSENAESVYFYKNNEVTEWGTVADSWAKRNEDLGTHSEIIPVPVVNFAACIQQYGMPYYLKIDIEGMDIECIRALAEFDVKPDYVSIEAEKITYKKLREDLDILMQSGYTHFKAIQQENIDVLKEPANSEEGRFVGHTFLPGSSGPFGRDLQGNWKSKSQIRSHFRYIYLLYRLFGDYGLSKKYHHLETVRKKLTNRFQKPIPGWYDIHAKHASCTN